MVLSLSRTWKVNTGEPQRFIRLAEMDGWLAHRGGEWTNGSFARSEIQTMLIVCWRKACSVTRRTIHDHIWPKPPPCAVNVLLALFPLRSTLTAAAFRPGLLLGSGFGKFKAGVLSFQIEHERVTAQPTAASRTCLMKEAATAAIVTVRVYKPGCWRVRLFSPGSASVINIRNSSLFPLAFRVVSLASSEARLNLLRSLRCRASLAMSGCICPLAPDWRTAIDRPRNGPRSIAAHFVATDVNSRRLACCVSLLSSAPTARRLANRGNASTCANEAPTEEQ
jgi:hypothetical protein